MRLKQPWPAGSSFRDHDRCRQAMKTVLLVAGVVLSILAVCHAQDRVVIVSHELQPYTSPKNGGSGFLLDTVRRAFAAAGVQVVYQFYPWKRCEVYVGQGKVFAAVPYTKSRERLAQYNFSDPIVCSHNRFFYKKSKFPGGLDWNSLEDFREHRFGGVLGYWYIPALERAGLNVTFSRSEEKILQLLINERIDFVILDAMAGLELLKRRFSEDASKIGTLAKPESVLANRLLISRKYPDHVLLTKKFNKGLKQIIANSEYDQLIKRYEIPRSHAVYNYPGVQ